MYERTMTAPKCQAESSYDKPSQDVQRMSAALIRHGTAGVSGSHRAERRPPKKRSPGASPVQTPGPWRGMKLNECAQEANHTYTSPRSYQLGGLGQARLRFQRSLIPLTGLVLGPKLIFAGVTQPWAEGKDREHAILNSKTAKLPASLSPGIRNVVSCFRASAAARSMLSPFLQPRQLVHVLRCFSMGARSPAQTLVGLLCQKAHCTHVHEMLSISLCPWSIHVSAHI